MAKRIGKSESTVKNYEAGKKCPRLDEAAMLAPLYGVKVARFESEIIRFGRQHRRKKTVIA